MIRIRNLSFSYGERKIIDAVSFDFPRKGLFMIMGKSGCGKTTLLSLLIGTLSPDKGKIESPCDLSSSVVFQSPLLLDYLNVEDNVILNLLLNGTPREKALEIGRRNLKKVYLDGMETKNVKKLSGGEMMRVSLARALSSGGDVLILDEPTGSLDEKTSWEIYSLLEELSKEILVILVSHDEKNLRKLKGELVVMEEGKLSQSGQLDSAIVLGKKKENSHLSAKEALGITRKFLSFRKTRFIISTFFLAFTLTLLYLIVNVRISSTTVLEDMANYYYDSDVIRVSSRERIASAGMLSLDRFSVPDDEALLQIGINEYLPSLSYFIPISKDIDVNKEFNTSILPVIEQDATKIYKGRTANSSDECIVNTMFAIEAGLLEDECIGRKVIFSHTVDVRLSCFESIELFKETYSLTIVGISMESSAFNKPCLYYDYFSLLDHLSKYILYDFSTESSSPVTVADLFLLPDTEKEDFRNCEVLASTRYRKDIIQRAARIYGNDMRIQSNCEEMTDSAGELLISLSDILSYFVALTLVTSFMLSYLSNSSLYDENMRLFALVQIQKGKTRNKNTLSFSLLLCSFLMTIFFLTILSVLSSLLIILLLKKFSLPAFLSSFSPLPFLFVVLLAFIFSLLSSILPLRRLKKADLKKELEAEE